MNKENLIQAISQKTGETKKNVEFMLNAFMQTVTESLSNGESVKLTGFGIFEVKNRAARKGRNPRTSEEIHIPARKVPFFKAGAVLKSSVGN